MSPLSQPVRGRATAASGARRQRAVAAAREIASEGGYEAVSMGEVARRSGVSRATLYRYFSSKNELLVEVSLDFNARLHEELERHPPQGASVGERLVDVFTRVVRAAAADPRLLAATLRAFFANEPDVHALAPEVRRFGGVFVDLGLGGIDVPGGADIARVLGPFSLAMVIRISSGLSDLEQALEEIRVAVRLLVKE